jgi:hypothetical protein
VGLKISVLRRRTLDSMSQDTKKTFPDPLVRQRLFPEPASIFDFAPIGLSDALRDGIVVVDTNVLLVPYTTGKASLEQIRRTYHRLVSEGRLRIPGQVAREFAEHRAEKLKMLFQQLSRKRAVNLELSLYPLLEDVPAYSDMRTCEDEISSKLGEYRKLIGSLLDTVEKWQWNDPVSNIYRDLFKGSISVDPVFDRDELLKELRYRQEHRIPPGYKDANNEHSGIGDLLIWKAILQIGKLESRHVVFVSGDEKSDWRYQSENSALYPRYELLDEFRRSSQNKSLLIISFAELLEQLGAPAPVVAEIKLEEAVSSSNDRSVTPHQAKAQAAEMSVFNWLREQYPDRNVYRGSYNFPDFIVDNLRAYEVKYTRIPSNAARRMREMLTVANRYSNSNHMPMSIVFVVDDVESANTLSGIALRASRSGGANSDRQAQTEIIVGLLLEGNYFEVCSKFVVSDLEESRRAES